MRTITPTPQHLDEQQTRLIKENGCFSSGKMGHTAYHYSRKEKIATISKGITENSNHQEKN